MTKKRFSIMLLALLMASVMIFTAGCGSDKDTGTEASADRIAQLEAENARLKEELNQLKAQAGLPVAQGEGLKDWTLNAQAWSDGNGATITFTAIPNAYQDGMKAALSIRMGELEAESTNCNWDGAAFTGSVELSAADGYSYFCILTAPDGSQQEVELNSPGQLTDEALVYLGSSLTAYANFVVEDWDTNAGSLVIKSGYIHCQLPQMTFSNVATGVSGTALLLKLNDAEIVRQDITLEQGEGNGSFEAVLADQAFPMPLIQDESQLSLWLEVSLDNGTIIDALGGSWYGADGQLHMVVG